MQLSNKSDKKNEVMMAGFQTPIVLYQELDAKNEISIMREDLLPFCFGGNKVRIAHEFFKDMESQGKNCMVGYGNSRSNLCRVLANMSYARTGKKGLCHIISSTDDDGVYGETNNSLIAKNCGAVFHTCTKQDVAFTVDRVMKICEDEGLKPYYIYGDNTGHGNEAVPVRAYEHVYDEVKSKFDYIFLATGTGMTQAGLVAGEMLNQGNEKIIGISVARKKEQELPIIRDYVEKYLQSVGLSVHAEPANKIFLEDEYIGGGYGKCSDNVIKTIRYMMMKFGIALDPTYTGKAFYGMMDFLKKNNINGKRILFIHTGGVPLFFDELPTIFENR